MGTFGGYTGQVRIPEEKKAEFSERMIKLLNYGGMMAFEPINIHFHEMGLLIPAQLSKEGDFYFHYNYFEDDAWEPAGFDSKDCHIWSGKIGSAEFNDVITAAHFLYEIYSEGPGFAEVNDDIMNSTRYMGWINHLFGTKHSMERRFRLWENAEYTVLQHMEMGYDASLKEEQINGMIPSGMAYYAGGTELSDLMYIMHGTESLVEENAVSGTYPADVYACREALRKYLGTDHTQEDTGDANDIWELIRLDRKSREARAVDPDDQLAEIGGYTLFLPARVIVYLTAEHEKENFWKLWKNLRDTVYHDERMKQYAPAWLETERRRIRKMPIEPIRTSDFLRQDAWFTFHSTPEEIRDRPNYYISDDDRLYWWDGTDEVVISDTTDQWLKELAEEHKEIVRSLREQKEKENNFYEFIQTLIEIDQYYKRICPFRNMFYEFLKSGDREEYRAAVELLGRLSERNREDGRIIEKVRWSWDMTSRNVTHNPGRIAIKRYLAVMANTKLRMKYFGF